MNLPSAAGSVTELSGLGLIGVYLPVLVAAFLVTLLVTPVARRVAFATGVIDRPDEARKVHRRPVAYLGGLAVLAGLVAGIAVGYMLNVPLAFRSVPVSIVVGMFAIVLTGLADDVWGWDPRWKVAGQLVAAAALAESYVGTQAAAGFIEFFTGTRDLSFEMVLPLVGGFTIDPVDFVGVALIAVFVLGGCNAANLIDGLDGLLSGTVAIAATGFLLISLLAAMWLTDADVTAAGELLPEKLLTEDDGSTLAGARIVLAMALIGATLGFLPHNWNPATIFLGDTGSLLLGFTCVTLVLMLGDQGQTHLVVAGLIVFGLPIMDTVLAIFRRKVQGLPASSPDAEHMHHQFKRMLGGVKSAVVGMWCVEGLLTLVGVTLALLTLTHEVRVVVPYAVFIGIFGMTAIVGIRMGRRAARRSSGDVSL
ncbi:MAG: undecaprenyl/decaprenyl-phosphate alpha-N-acetylglucosaminyl 1-phosphate transferase [Phycisphaerales bacterium]|nr:undecaprenyl/decaprenyl-phosphate alpha-N-acetylglucosaminyl 1-phosphate transferase [Phycisphaerales bacterium]